MPKSWSRIFLSFLAVPLLFASCKRQYSPDNTLPVVYPTSIVIGSDNQIVYGLNPGDGSKNWELSLPCKILSSPVLYGGMVYIANSTSDTLYKINAKTGVIVKKITYTGGNVGATATPIADANLIYLPSLNGTLYAIDTGLYTTKWTFIGSYATPGQLKSSPTIFNGKIYLASTNGHVYCIDKTLGPNTTITGLGGEPSPLWDYPGQGMTSTVQFVSSPAVAAPYLYIGGLDSNMYCIYLDTVGADHSLPDTGVVRWTYKTKGKIQSSPAAYAGNCIFGCDDFRLYCLDSIIDPAMGIITPTARWIDSMHSEITSSPYAANQVVYVGCKDYKLYAVNIINGGYKWSFASNGVITSSPLVYNGTVYIGSYDNNLYALDSARGTMKWSKNINGQINCSPVLDDFSRLTGYNSQISGYTN